MATAEYLKKYLEKPKAEASDYEDSDAKRHKKHRHDKHHRHHHRDRSDKQRHGTHGSGMRIIDDDVNMSDIRGGHTHANPDREEFRPQIVGYVDDDAERPAKSARRGHSTQRSRHDSPDASPPRRRDASARHDSPDASPPRRRDASAHGAAVAAGSLMPPPPPMRPAERAPPAGSTLSGSAPAPALSQPGLHTRVAAEAAIDAATARAQGNYQVDEATALGAGNATVYRDRSGRKIDVALEQQRREEAAQRNAAAATPAWGTGLAQQRSKAEERERKRADGAGPLARYDIDASVDAEKRAAMRFDDPMAEHLASRKASASAAPNKPRYRGPPPPPNRFNIAPGFRWDGVDRSNGYEKQFFLAQASARSRAQQAHEWAVQDM